MRSLALLFILGCLVMPGNACGGMTQIDPPSLELQVGPSDGPPESILDDVEDFLVIC